MKEVAADPETDTAGTEILTPADERAEEMVVETAVDLGPEVPRETTEEVEGGITLDLDPLPETAEGTEEIKEVDTKGSPHTTPSVIQDPPTTEVCAPEVTEDHIGSKERKTTLTPNLDLAADMKIQEILTATTQAPSEARMRTTKVVGKSDPRARPGESTEDRAAPAEAPPTEEGPKTSTATMTKSRTSKTRRLNQRSLGKTEKRRKSTKSLPPNLI